MSMQLFHLSPGEHNRVQALLPWYVNGSLEASERSAVESHLIACAECQADVGFERRLAGEVCAMSVEAAQGWAALLPRLQAAPRPLWLLADRIGEAVAGLRRGWRERPAWALPALAAQLGLVAILGAVTLSPRPAEPQKYLALGATRPAPPANLVVIFRPDTREAELRAILRDVDGRLVGGPTSADAYLVQVPAETRASSLARLRSRTDIALAEPVDAGPQR
jgi:hypothetical protein